jgi:hypothetical protein
MLEQIKKQHSRLLDVFDPEESADGSDRQGDSQPKAVPKG